MITGLAATFNLNKLMGFFNTNCIFDSQLKFNCSLKRSVRNPRSIPFFDETLNTIFRKLHQPFIHVIHGPLCRIDEKKSLWGTFLGCEYAIFIPLIMSIFATIWFVIFAMCGHGGRGTEAYVLIIFKLYLITILILF